jgi:hypothetical protein
MKEGAALRYEVTFAMEIEAQSPEQAGTIVRDRMLDPDQKMSNGPIPKR